MEVRGAPHGEEPDRELLLSGLRRQPRSIPSKFLYDERGSLLFEEITELPEYYQTRTEREILAAAAEAITRRTAARQLVELGPGSASKTRLLLDALWQQRTLTSYVPIDVSEEMLRSVAEEIAVAYPGLAVHAIVGDFTEDAAPLPPVAPPGPRLTLFLGGTIGNLHPEREAPAFLARLARAMAAGDFLLLGVDLIKDRGVLEAAYDDAGGVTAEFNRNILRVVNRLLEADFDPACFAHRAFYDPASRWIEMRLVAVAPQRVRLGFTGEVLELAAGEEIHTEISAKYDAERVRQLFAASGFRLLEEHADPRRQFALYLGQR
ncbi:MAG TPA: L-histidine N(alpha)-methyltransferase [Thermoanaerobaculia bacterium]|nr:L-histidine N(alpha)-methyltransferase [Thermoanaerobaculia bacterium]